MTTRPDVQRKRDAARYERDKGATARRREAVELERRAATITGMIATMDEERIKLLIQAALLRLAVGVKGVMAIRNGQGALWRA